MLTLFMVGTFWFFFLLGAAFITLLAIMENSKNPGSWTTFSLIVLGTILYFLGAKDFVLEIISYPKYHPGYFLAGFAGYYIGGFLYAFMKWYYYLKSAYERGARNSYGKYDAKNNKGMIIAWATYWPISIIWTVINQPVKRLFGFLFDKIIDKFQNQTDKIFKPDSDTR